MVVEWESTSAFNRVGEILIVSTTGANPGAFIRTLCGQVAAETPDMVFGQLDIADDLSLYLYGLKTNPSQNDFIWDIVAGKMLGFILLFDWFEPASVKEVKKLLDFTTARYQAPVICVGDTGQHPIPYKHKLFKPAIALSSRCKFTFCSNTDAGSISRTLISLLDILLQNTA